MGEVYRAVDTRLGREVAVKMLPAAYAHDEHRRKRLEREARAASALNHPNIVTIHDIGSEGGRSFIVMELVRGMTLTQLISQGGLDIRLALQYALQMAAALQCAHAAGVLHRDIKPGNVMLTPDGLVKVMDFGLAKVGLFGVDGETQSRLAADDPLTEEGATLGTVAYMSPEQARGDTLNERSEIFSFGIVLYEMITGRRPFVGNNPYSTLEAICRMDPLPLGELRADLPAGVSALVRRCLAKDPGERFASFADLVGDLRALQAGPIGGPISQDVSGRPPDGRPSAGSSRGMAPVEHTSSIARSAAPAAPPVSAPGDPTQLDAVRVTPVSSAPSPPTRRPWPWIAGGVALAVLAAVAWGALSGRWPGSPTTGAGAGTAAARAYEKVAEGRRLLDRYDRPGNIDRAQALFEAAYGERPDYAPAYVGLAEALYRHVDRDPHRAVLNRGLEAARKAIALEDQMASAHAVLGMLLMEAGEHDQARASITRALQLDPKSRLALIAMSDVQVSSGDSAAAEAVARKAVELHPGDWMVHSNLAYILFRQSRFGDAAASFEQALERAPDNVRTLSNLSGMYHMLGRTEDAASVLQRAIEVAPSDRTYSNLGTLRFFQGRYRESTQLFEKAVELAPNTYACWGNLGDARRWTIGQESRAAEAYASAISLVRTHLEAKPGDKDARASLASYLAKTGRTDEALAELAKAEDREAADYFYTATVVHELAGQRDGALAELDRAMALGYSPVEIEADPELIALRRDRRFQELLAKHRQP